MRDPNDVEKGRRVLLHGMIAGGCASLIPVLWGCSPESPPAASGTDKASPDPQQSERSASGEDNQVQPAAPPSTAQASKVSKQQAQYQETPNADQQCSGCLHFIAEGGQCKLVEGQIAPDGWCTLWVAKPT